MINICPICKNKKLKSIYYIRNLPIFQNVVFDDFNKAKNILKADIDLTQCLNCNFVFNKNYDKKLLDYNKEYHNEQHYSDFFVKYLKDLIEILKKSGLNKKSKIVEIGCGKGYFLNIMKESGYSIKGFDPAYEGDNPDIIKNYFNESYSKIDADFIILRHTLEHIENPIDFIYMIAKANNFKGKIFIEVPDFDWIYDNNAFWDIFYEHCNYFNKFIFKNLFDNAIVENIFNGQYMYVVADLNKIKNIDNKIIGNVYKKNFLVKEFKKYKKILKNNNNIAIWGGASKGVTFLNILDSNKKYINFIFDINPLKINKYIPGTGHIIKDPKNMKSYNNIETIIIMNENYIDEINNFLKNYNFKKIIVGYKNEKY